MSGQIKLPKAFRYTEPRFKVGQTVFSPRGDLYTIVSAERSIEPNCGEPTDTGWRYFLSRPSANPVAWDSCGWVGEVELIRARLMMLGDDRGKPSAAATNEGGAR